MRRWLVSLVGAGAWLLAGAGAAQAVVVNLGGVARFGVALATGTARSALPAGSVVTSGSCSDPALQFTPDLNYLSTATPLCWGGGPVVHSAETFAFTWDADRRYWSDTRGYMEQFLGDVAASSGTLSTPFAVTGQYTDSSTLTPGSSFLVNGRATDQSKYGGGCIDYGTTVCQFGTSSQTGPGSSYPPSGCTPTGTSWTAAGTNTNDVCLTDAQIQGEVQSVAQNMNVFGRTQPGFTPLVVLMLPARVEACLDATGSICSANSTAAALLCSYHSEVSVSTPQGTQTLAYAVQPWTPYTNCDEPGLPGLGSTPTPKQFGDDAGARMVSPLSQALTATLVDPGLNGWAARDGSEVYDNTPGSGISRCAQLGPLYDTTSLNGRSYVLQREFNNGGAMESDPITYFGCAPSVTLAPSFVIPSAVDQGDVVSFDGSATQATLLVPNAGYAWDFGDNTTAVGPSVVHSYAQGGTYTVKLTVTDRGNDQQTLSQTIQVLGPDGQPVPPATNLPPAAGGGGGSGGSSGGATPGAPKPPFAVKLLLMPQSKRAVLARGLSLRVTANASADGYATVTISRAQARQAGIKTGNARYVVVGRGTVSGVANGTMQLRLRLSRSVANKLAGVRRLVLSVHLTLISPGGQHSSYDVAGRY